MELSSVNQPMKFERNADGTLVTMSPTGGISGNQEAKASAYLLTWIESRDLGEVFSSSTGFRLPNGAIRSPDAAFIARSRLPQGWDEGEDQFLSLAPDFVIEIRSKSDSLSVLQGKMEEYITSGDRQDKQAWVYRGDSTITQYPPTAILSGEEAVPGFTLPLKSLL